MAALGFEVLFGALTVTGSLLAFGKLQELLPGRPLTLGRPQTLLKLVPRSVDECDGRMTIAISLTSSSKSRRTKFG